MRDPFLERHIMIVVSLPKVHMTVAVVRVRCPLIDSYRASEVKLQERTMLLHVRVKANA